MKQKNIYGMEILMRRESNKISGRNENPALNI